MKELKGNVTKLNLSQLKSVRGGEEGGSGPGLPQICWCKLCVGELVREPAHRNISGK